uniref:G-protein coupled receptors family 1 profile domain-containing protein n=1 Tax=Musca domestica TaxID=7370 RepID=A0A1I8M9E2_MUSDO
MRRAGPSTAAHLSCIPSKASDGKIIQITSIVMRHLKTVICYLSEWRWSTVAMGIMQSITMVVGVYTTINSTTIAEANATELAEEYDSSNLIVCLPNNSTDCIKYVNSTNNGLIALNESIYPALKGFHNNYDYRLIARINPFWLKFDPPTETYYRTMAILYMVIFAIGTFGNGLVIFMFFRCKSLRTSPYMLVLNLAISDFIIVFKCPLAALNNYMNGPVLGDWGCRIYGFVGGLSGTASIGMLTIIALDRYSVVVNPLNPNRSNYITQYYTFLIIFVWIYALTFSSMPMLDIGMSRYVPEGYFTTCSFDYLDTSTKARVFMFVFFVCAWLVPLSVICYCYFHILKVVFTARDLPSNKNKQNIEMRLSVVVLLVIMLWFTAWTPYSIVAICGIFEQEQYLTPTRAGIPAIFCKTASCLNPFLYTISHKRFRQELLKLFCKRKRSLRYSLTRSSYMTKSSRRNHNLVTTAGTSFRGGGGGSLYQQKPTTTFKRNIRSASAFGDGLMRSDERNNAKYVRPLNRCSMVAERSISRTSDYSTSLANSIVAGREGSGAFVIDKKPSGGSEEDVIFIVSGGRSSVQESQATQVFVIGTDSGDVNLSQRIVNSPPTALETSF